MGHRGSCSHKATMDRNTLRKECIYLEACELLHGGIHRIFVVMHHTELPNAVKYRTNVVVTEDNGWFTASTTQWYWKGIVKAGLLK